MKQGIYIIQKVDWKQAEKEQQKMEQELKDARIERYPKEEAR